MSRSGGFFLLLLPALLLGGAAGCDKAKSLASKATGLAFGGDFEGEITMSAKRSGGSASGPSSFVIGVKRPKYRVDTTGSMPSDNPALAIPGMSTGGAALLLDPPQKKGWALIPAQKKAIVLDFEKMKAAKSGAGGKPKPSGPPPTIEKTGKKDTVAGYDCEIWNVVTDGKKSEICAADGITWIDLTDLGWSSPELTVAAVASGANRFPLRIVTHAASGADEVRLEATKIEKKKLDDARFTVPADYQVIDIAAMMESLPKLPTFGR